MSLSIFVFNMISFVVFSLICLHRTSADPALPVSRSLFNDLLLLDTNKLASRLFRPSVPRPSLFHVVKFPNDECIDLSNQVGTCYTQLQCKAFGGSGTAACAKGYGTCCIIARSCHNVTSQKVVYFTNPSYPASDRSSNYCDLNVEARDADVCQLRIDFLDFQLDPPISGFCADDRLRLTVSGMPVQQVPLLCGTIRNTHLYVHLPASDAVDRTVNFLFETNHNGSYRWHLRITQVDCGRGIYANRISRRLAGSSFKRTKRSFLLINEAALQVTPAAPAGCSQYFTSRSGVIESFNFGHYLNNMDYAICIEHLPASCRIAFQASKQEFGIQSAIRLREADPNSIINSLGAQGDESCADDYLMIPGGSSDGEYPTKDRYCGARLQPANLLNHPPNPWQIQPIVSKAAGPIVLRFHSESYVSSAELRVGFRIKYDQITSGCYLTNTQSLSVSSSFSSSTVSTTNSSSLFSTPK